MMNEFDYIQEAVNYIRQQYDVQAKTAVILGTGATGFGEKLDEVLFEIAVKDIPHFPINTVKSHLGKLTVGKIGSKEVIILHGRVHYYEGFSMQEVVRSVRVLSLLGVKKLYMSNASGGLNDNYRAGDLVFINDHINLMPDNPLRGKNIDELGIRFPDMSNTYDQKTIDYGLRICTEATYPSHQGVYCALAGPNLETPAEYAYLKKIGGDLVGMSTVPEVIAAVHCGMRICVIAVVSNECHIASLITETTIEDVIKTVKSAETKINHVLYELILNDEV